MIGRLSAVAATGTTATARAVAAATTAREAHLSKPMVGARRKAKLGTETGIESPSPGCLDAKCGDTEAPSRVKPLRARI
jgi:hypothetical protein